MNIFHGRREVDENSKNAIVTYVVSVNQVSYPCYFNRPAVIRERAISSY